ncbi:nuclease-related domain-containing protein [Bacillus suaedae]|uniref:NERD domain-containing protein n=1 Tax=Halalkalibacter suaedae TaxID=2822140 RepID=A0A940WTP0_9BACI|nr:nuclease-related domain-containing protein [Bacillus suaedae]MBP3952564.1 NERD domain-containing protein [Bacillus suaedae]
MIKKPRDIPLKILKLEALLRRLPQFHPSRKKLEDELAKNYAGYRGEQAVDYQLKFLKEDNWQFLFNVRLAGIKDTFFQMDSLLISDRFLVLLEIKNISGTLIFDQEFNQLIRVTSEQEDSYLDPLLQLQRQKVQMQTWLQTYKNPQIPISSLVVISQPSTRIKATSNPTTLAKKVVHAAALPDMIHSFSTIYKDPILTKNEVNKLTKLLMKHNIESNPNVLNQFQINPN